jgi:hypothetical protein
MSNGVRRTMRWIVFSSLFLTGLAQAEIPVYKLSLLPEDESVYAPPAAPKEEDGANLGGVNLDLKITYLNDYIYRGVNHSAFVGRTAKPNVQFDGTVFFNTGKIPHPFFGLFANVYNNDPVSRFQEIRPFGGLEWTLRPFTIVGGVNAYIYPEREVFNTAEVWSRLTFDDSVLFKSERPMLSPYGYAAYDYDKSSGFYLEAGLKHDFVIEDTGLTFTVLGDVGYFAGIRQQFIFVTKKRNGFQHYDIGLIGSYSLNNLLKIKHRYGDVSLNGYLYYTDGINHDIMAVKSKIWGGVGVQFKY